jgi:excisionase family DNA binding protein
MSTATPDTTPAPDLTDRTLATVTIDETAAVFRVGRTTVYAKVRSGEWPSIRVGRRVLIPASWVRDQLGVTITD